MGKLLKLKWGDPDQRIYQSSYYYQMDQYDIQVVFIPRMSAYKCTVFLNKEPLTETVTFYDAKKVKAWFRIWRLQYRTKATA